eukprot:NODE_1859_length_1356_cov_60.222132_g1767_i0.p1 GENE.NODE_1859_length_1356_cov_60.222132_g1767_i0~~NODE_1859_length_1356_cov_60.222132_g1767_i0.p1  ORF type:complete len:426 (+),score=64.27 NODE_1859_length_1356_cov_60.222132_g1767_i0:22-1299(+)
MDQYELLHPIGAGAMGRVYQAKERRTGKVSALKQVACSSLADANVALKEAWLIGKCKHRNIIELTHIFLCEESSLLSVCLVMPLYSSDLMGIMKQHKHGLPPDMIADIGLQIGSALEYIHNLHPPLAHRDIKPQNILMDGTTAVLSDFGVAQKLTQSFRTLTGTPNFMAPEQATGQYNVQADLWGFGCLLVSMMLPTGSKNCNIPVLYIELLTSGEPAFHQSLESQTKNYPLFLTALIFQLLRANAADRMAAVDVVRRLSTRSKNMPGVPGGSPPVCDPVEAPPHRHKEHKDLRVSRGSPRGNAPMDNLQRHKDHKNPRLAEKPAQRSPNLHPPQEKQARVREPKPPRFPSSAADSPTPPHMMDQTEFYIQNPFLPDGRTRELNAQMAQFKNPHPKSAPQRPWAVVQAALPRFKPGPHQANPPPK